MPNNPVIPWDAYRSMQAGQQRQDDDPVMATVNAMRASEARQAIMQAGSPDDTAKVTRIARTVGEPPALVDGRTQDYEKAIQADRMTSVMSSFPIIGSVFSAAPRTMVAAQDDHKAMGLLGGAWDTIKKVPAELKVSAATLVGMVNDMTYSLADIGNTLTYPIDAALATAINSPIGQAVGLPTYDPDAARAKQQAFVGKLRDQNAQWRESMRPQYSGPIQEGLLRGIDTSTLTLAALLTRNPTAAASTIGAAQAGTSYQDARAAGKDFGTTVRYAATQGMVETATELAPESALLGSLAKHAGPAKVIASYLAEELPGEMTATFLQSLSEWQVMHPDQTYGDWVKSLPADEAQTVLGVIGGGAFVAGAAKAGQAGAALLDKAQAVRTARQNSDALTHFEKAAADSKLRARDPDAYNEVVQHVAADAGVEHVLIPAEAVREYMQSDGYDRFSDAFEPYRDQVEEAYSTGGDVVLPASFALGALPGTPAWSALKDDMRLTSGGMSAREAQTFGDAMADVVAELETEMQADHADLQQQVDAQGKLLQSVQAKLQDAGFTPYSAAQQATLLVQRITTRAARLGRDVTGNEFTTEVRQVLPPELAAARNADATDLVINALRKGADATTQSGETLLEWISARGGLNDTGGDLKSMGLDKWHLNMPQPGKLDKKGRKARPTPIKGRRKLLRDFDPKQASFGGPSGAGDYGLDSTLRSAIESGYFPELQGAANQDGVDTLDSQTLLDAIAAELAGSPRYSESAKVDPYRAAADELAQLLSERGVDPSSLSDAELRDVVARLDQGGDLTPDVAEYYQAAYHGSPHIFDRFSLDKIGTGEGAQAYGWGLYFAGRKEIAEHYREVLSSEYRGDATFNGETFKEIKAKLDADKNAEGDDPRFDALLSLDLIEQAGSVDKAIENADQSELKSVREVAEWMREHYDQLAINKDKGRLYHVEIPNDDEYLLWDKPLSEQPEKVRAAIERLKGGDKPVESLTDDELVAALGGLEQTFGDKEKTGQGFYRELGALKGSDQAASLALHNAGIAGIKYLDGGSRSAGDGSFNYVVIDDSRVSIKAYEQSYADGPRGRIRFEQTPVIELFQGRNMSTLLHEIGHQYLEELRFDATGLTAPDQLIQDWQTTQDWFSANGFAVVDGVIPTEAHELWARGFERYLMEGKAPSSALARVFETFRGWMMAIYKKVDALRSPITPEIREVFDRLLATDDEIAAARDRQMLEPAFKDAAAVGMAGPEFDAYRAQFIEAKAKASGELLAKTMAAVKRRVMADYRDNRSRLEAEIADEVDARPLFRALSNLKSSPISDEWLRENMGNDVFDLLPKRVPPLWSKRGVHPDAIAELSGYGSGRQMIDALIGAERQQRDAVEQGDKRGMRDRVIQTETDAEMNRRQGDPLTDGTIEREALAAVNNEKQGELLASEVRILARKTGQRPTPYRIAREWARGKVRRGTVSQEAMPAAIQRHARSVSKAGREAEKAILAGKFDEALRFKQQQMLSSALLAEAKAAHDEVQAAQQRMDKIARRKTSKSVDQDYLDQAHALLEQVDLRPRSQKSIERQGKWAEWAAQREAEGFDVVVPQSFEATLGKDHWTRLPVETMLALDETVQQIMHLGRLKQTLLDGKERREFDALVKEAQDGAGNIKQKPPRDLMEPGWWDAVKSGAALADASLLKMETVFDWLDGGNSNGVFNRIAFKPIADAQAHEQDMLKDYYGRIKALFEAVPGNVAKRWQDQVVLPFTNRETVLPERMKRYQLIAAALNTGNAGNLQRLTDGHGWNAPALLDYLGQELSADEWAFVQGVWDTIDTLWPEIETLEKRVNGVAPERVEATEIVTPHGTVRGGYYPVIYDSSRSYQQEEHRAASDNSLFEANAIRATTRSGSTKARAEKVNAPVLLDLGVINRHLGEVIHDITHREAVMQAWKFLTNERVMRAVDGALGVAIRQQFKPWVKFVANSWAMERAGNEGFGKWIGKLRANATAVGMGLRVTTMVTQIAGYSNSIEAVGEAAFSQALARTTASPVETTRFVLQNSDEVRHRMDTLDRDLRAEINRMAAAAPVKGVHALTDAKRFFYHGIGYMDRMVVVPTWLAGYNKAIAAGMDHDSAVYAGDKAVRVSQGAGSPKDLAAIQRGTGSWGKALQLMTMFYSYFSAEYQRQRTLARDATGQDIRRPRNLPRLAARAWWLLVVPPLLTELLKGVATGNGGPDDDEWWAEWVMRKLLSNAIGPIPLARDVFEPAWNAARGAGWTGTSISPLQRTLESTVNTARDAGKIARGEETKHATKDMLETAGYFTGLVPGQVASATQFLVDVGNGDADPQSFADWREGLMTGKIKD